jgi:hypothetical protein
MNPLTKEAQQVPRIQKLWNGDCWKALVRARNYKDIDRVIRKTIKTVDTDHGCGIISDIDEGKTELMLNLDESEITYENLDKNRKQWLNLISVEEFKQQY